MISIHAPREGSDTSCGTILPSTTDFYPRSPRGERRGGVQVGGRVRRISIHAPREGSDEFAGYAYMVGYTISIHAPREGSDCCPLTSV